MSREKPEIPRNRSPCQLPSEHSTASFWHSQPSALLTGHRSTRHLPKTAEVVVIGSGMTGTSVAYHLLTDPSENTRRDNRSDTDGPTVLLLEAREACWGATGRNGGHCQPILFEHPHDPSIGQFELSNLHALRSLIHSKEIDCEFQTQPGVRAIYSRAHLDAAELALFVVKQNAPDQANMLRIVTEKAELRRLRIPTALAAVVTDVAARFWPYKFVSNILEELLTSTDLTGSFSLQTLTPVHALEPYDDRRWTVKTPRGNVVAWKVVLATNAYTSHLMPNCADLIVPCRGQMSALLPPPSVSAEQRLKTSLGFLGDGIDDYLIQRPNEKGGHLMFGGGRGFGKSMGVADDSEIEPKTATYLRRKLLDVLDLDRSEELTATHEWSGIMGFSRDGLPWVGPVPNENSLFVAAGFTGHGMPNTWLSGKAVARMLTAGKSIIPMRTSTDGGKHLSATMRTPTKDEMESAAKEMGLPESYLITEERVQRAMEMEDVEASDWAEMERGRRGRESDRLPSGYA